MELYLILSNIYPLTQEHQKERKKKLVSNVLEIHKNSLFIDKTWSKTFAPTIYRNQKKQKKIDKSAVYVE